MARWMAGLVAAMVPVSAGLAADATAKDRAYTLTLMCSVVASADKNDADIQRTMDAVRKMGKAQGYDSKRVSSDAIQMAGALGSEMREHPDAMDKHRAACRKLKLIS